MGKGFQYQHAAATSNNEAVPVRVVGAGGALWRVIVLSGQSTHRVKQGTHCPMQLLAAAGKDHILFAQLNQFHAVTDTVRAGGARRGYRVVHAFNLERGGKAGRDGTAHSLCNAIRTDSANASFSQGVRGVDLTCRGRPPRASDNACSGVRDLIGLQAGLGNSLLQAQVGIARRIAHESPLFTVDMFRQVNIRCAGDMGAHASVNVILTERDPGTTLVQGLTDRS